MKNTTLAAIGGIALMSVSASQASAIIDSGTMMLSGTTYTVDDPSLASFINANSTTRVRWDASPNLGTASTAALDGTPPHTSSDYYWTLNSAALVSGTAVIPTTATYVQLDFTLTGGWVTGSKADQIFRKTELTGGTGSTTPSDQANLPWDTTAGAAIADGSYSVIVDLTPIGDVGTTWTQLRYDFFNESDQNNAPYPNAGGKTFTLDAVTYSTAIAPIPEPSAALLGALGLLGLLRRRR